MDRIVIDCLRFNPIGGHTALTVTFHGVRGSTPCHGDDISRYGGNTSCVSLSMPGNDPVIFDLGTGLRYFGRTQPTDGTFRGTCLLTHLHWDHTQGLPFFAPILAAGSQLDVYAPLQEEPGRTVKEAIGTFMQPPHFPISLEHLPGTLRFHDVGDTEFSIGDVDVMTRLIPHVGNTLGFRVTWNGRSVAYLSDHQMPHDGSFSMSAGARELVENADLVIHDSQYTPEEFAKKSDWGHCTVEYAIWLAASAKAKRLALYHHDPIRNDDAVDELALCAAQAGNRLGVEVFAASEGLSLTF
jgi:phosphoribosyl 1,2-cyclic phosphodiesterase